MGLGVRVAGRRRCGIANARIMLVRGPRLRATLPRPVSESDARAMLDATAGDYPQQLMKLPAPGRTFLEETARDPGRLRIAFSFDPGLAGSLHPENRAAIESTTAALERLGHDLVEVR